MEYSFDKFVDDRDAYFAYLESVKSKISPKLLKVYLEKEEGHPNYFHDMLIKKIALSGDSQFYKSGEDSVEIILVLGKREYCLKFTGVLNFSCNFVNNPQGIPFLRNAILGEILVCILGVSDTGNQIMEFMTSTNLEDPFSLCRIEFKKVSVKKLKRID